MTFLHQLRLSLLKPPSFTPAYGGTRTLTSLHHTQNNSTAFTKPDDQNNRTTQGKWLTLPPFNNTVNGASLGKNIAGIRQSAGDGNADTTTAIKWVMRCCPQLPRSLVQKLFRLRQVSHSVCACFSCRVLGFDVFSLIQTYMQSVSPLAILSYFAMCCDYIFETIDNSILFVININALF